MIRCTNVAARQAESYYSRDDYYTQDNPPASWYGKGAAALDLSEEKANCLFGELLRGKLPNGEEIPGGQGGKRRAGTDLTISAPKSLSIAALVYGDQRVIEAHNEAVRAALAAAEAKVQAREVVAGKTVAVTTGNLIARTVLHDTSRSADPNLHTHCVIINATQTAAGGWKAMENRELFKAQRELDTVYKSELALRVAQLGYQLRHTKNGFELAQVSDQQIKAFSQRTVAIDAALAERGLSREEASAEMRDKTALDTRDRKVHCDRDLLVSAWRDRAAELGLEISVPVAPLPAMTQDRQAAAKEAIDFATAHMSERQAAYSKRDFVISAMHVAAAYGLTTLGDVEEALNQALERGDLVLKSDGLITDRVSIQREQRMLEVELLGRGAVSAVASGTLVIDPMLNDRQRAAVEAALTTTNRVMGIQGLAGVGKTTLLNEFRRQAEACGYTLAGVAPSHSAVKALTEAGIDGKTLQNWEVSGSKLDDKTILVIDESSLASTRQLADALVRADKSGARILVVGDSGQYQSVEAGKGFAQLQAAGMQTIIVDTMLRQQTEIARDVAQLAAQGEGAASLERLEAAGSLQEIENDAERLERIAWDFCALSAEDRHDTLVLTGTNDARQEINAAIRERLGLARQGHDVDTFERGDLTAAQQRRTQFYAVADAIRFDKDYRSLGVKSGDILVVKAIRSNEIELARPDGSTVTFAPANLSGKGWTVGKLDKRELSAGDRIRVTGNIEAKEGRLRNAQRGTVLAVSEKHIQVQIDDGEKVVTIDLEDKKPLPLDYGYAATGHSAQGLGAKRVFLERYSGCRTASQRQFYTDVTRAKQELVVYTDSREKLGKSIGKQVDKEQALEQSNHLQTSVGVPEFRSARDSARLAAAKEAIEFAVEHMSERQAAYNKDNFLAVATSSTYGRATRDDVEEAFKKALAWGDLVLKSDGLITDRASIEREQRMLEVELLGRGAVSAIASGTLAIDPMLNERQRTAVEAGLTTTNRVMGIQGLAGVGKTTLLNEFRRQAEACGYTLAGVAPSHSAVKALAEAGINGKTLQSWEAAGSKLDDKTILVIDESSLASTRQLMDAMVRAEKSGARILVVGDSGQYQSVEAGKGFAQLQAAGMQTIVVDTMLRQKTEITREVARLSAEGNGASALTRLEAAGCLMEIEDGGRRLGQIARDFCALSADERLDTLVLTGTNSARKSINAAIRKNLGLTGQGYEVETFVRGDLTVAEQRRAQFYGEGDAVRFDKDYKSLEAKVGDIYRVAAVRENEVDLVRPDGSTVVFTPASLSGRGLTVGKLDKRELSAGDRIRVTGNIEAKEGRLRNAQRGTVLAVSEKHIQVQIDDGEKVVTIDLEDKKPLSLDYGYAATGHSAQGLGAKRVFLERYSDCRTASQRQFYTDVTRAKQELVVYTDSRAKLGNSIGQLIDKEQALEQPVLEMPGAGDAGLSQKLEPVTLERMERAADVLAKALDYGLGF